MVLAASLQLVLVTAMCSHVEGYALTGSVMVFSTSSPSATQEPEPTAPPSPRPTPTSTLTPTPRPTLDPCRKDGSDRASLERRLRCAWPGPQPGHPATDDEAVWTVDNESSFRQMAHGGRHHSFWQFKLSTYHSSGGSGDPHEHSIEEQTRVAWEEYQKNGWEPWPDSRRRFGPN
jgi:hypothetical protein